MTMARIRIILAAALVSAALPVRAQSPSPAPSITSSPAQVPNATPSTAPSAADLAHDRIDAMWKTGAAEAWFADSLLAAVPFAKINPIVDQVKAALGTYRATTGGHGVYVSQFEKGSETVQIHLDVAGKIDGLLMRPPKLAAIDLDDALKRLQQLSGTSAYVLVEDRSHRAAFNDSTPLAVGSAFKLAVLAALKDRVARGELRWDRVFPLDPHWKSLPSGVLQSWPDRTPITLATYASEMISISDNTAADASAAIAGDAALARYESRNHPLLRTRELFLLRSPANASLLAKWIDGSPAQRRAVRTALAALPEPDSDAQGSAPGDLRAEWLFSPDELCNLMSRVADLPYVSINPGVADPADFKRIAFKGGSEPGVLSMVTSVVTHSGHTDCLAAIDNDPARDIDSSAFAAAYSSVLSALALK
jgi:beta-lactamase class A